MTGHAQDNHSGRGNDRRFSVSANRGAARHRLRYVEAGGALVDTDECSFCQSSPDLDWQAGSTASPTSTPPGGNTSEGPGPEKD